MTEEKKKRGRPPGSTKKTIMLEDMEGEFRVDKKLPEVYDAPKSDHKINDEPSQYAKPKPTYDPFSNPLFKSKMGIKKDEK